MSTVKRLVVAFVLFSFGLVSVGSISLAWTATDPLNRVAIFGGNGIESGRSVAIDSLGNIYTTGSFTGSVDFDPGVGKYILKSAGESDVFVSKLDFEGDFVWAKRFGGIATDDATSIAVDSSGAVYVVGSFKASVTIRISEDVYMTSGTADDSEDGFVLKLTSVGSFSFIKPIGGRGASVVNAITIDSFDNVYIAGEFERTASFPTNRKENNRPVSLLLTSAGRADAFIAKFDDRGSAIWVKQLGGVGKDVATSLDLDSTGNVFCTGYFEGVTRVGSGAEVGNLRSAGMADAFVSKLNSDGTFIWAKQFGGTQTEHGNSVGADGSGNAYISGYFGGTADFDPGAGSAILTVSGYSDAFVVKLSSDGTFIWADGFGGYLSDSATTVGVDATGNVYVAGFFADTADFHPGAGLVRLTARGSDEAFVVKLNSDGGFLWADQLGADYALALALGSGMVVITGSFNGIADFDPSSAETNMVSEGGPDVFILGIDLNGNAILAAESHPVVLLRLGTTLSDIKIAQRAKIIRESGFLDIPLFERVRLTVLDADSGSCKDLGQRLRGESVGTCFTKLFVTGPGILPENYYVKVRVISTW